MLLNVYSRLSALRPRALYFYIKILLYWLLGSDVRAYPSRWDTTGRTPPTAHILTWHTFTPSMPLQAELRAFIHFSNAHPSSPPPSPPHTTPTGRAAYLHSHPSPHPPGHPLSPIPCPPHRPSCAPPATVSRFCAGCASTTTRQTPVHGRASRYYTIRSYPSLSDTI